MIPSILATSSLYLAMAASSTAIYVLCSASNLALKVTNNPLSLLRRSLSAMTSSFSEAS